MISDALRRRITSWLLPSLVCLAAVAGGWLSTSLPPRAAAADSAIDWRLPQWKAPEVAQASRRLAERSIWEPQAAASGAPGGAAQPLTPPDWRIIAVAVTREERVAMLAVGSDRPQELRVGDRLPGGAIIRAIEPDRLTIELDGQRRLLRLAPQ